MPTPFYECSEIVSFDRPLPAMLFNEFSDHDAQDILNLFDRVDLWHDRLFEAKRDGPNPVALTTHLKAKLANHKRYFREIVFGLAHVGLGRQSKHECAVAVKRILRADVARYKRLDRKARA